MMKILKANLLATLSIEFLACDFEIILDVIVESLKNNELQHHDQCDKLFKKAHKLYENIKFFEKKYC